MIINQEERWDKVLNVSMSLKELQILFDSLGNQSYNDLTNIYQTMRQIDIPYSMNEQQDLYDQLDDVIESLGGYKFDE